MGKLKKPNESPTASATLAGAGVVRRAASILRVLGEVPTGVSLGQIAKRVGMARSTVQRLVAALETEGLIMTGVGAGTISLGPEFMRLARQARPAIIERVRPLMESVSQSLSETVDLSMVQRRQIVFLDQVVGAQRLLAVSHVGDAFPLHCSSVGKAYLATLTEEEIRRVIGESYEQRTPQTILTLQDLIHDLEPVRSSGVGLDLEEHTAGICAAGIVFTAQSGEWYGLSVPMPVSRFSEKRRRTEALLRRLRGEAEMLAAGQQLNSLRVASENRR